MKVMRRSRQSEPVERIVAEYSDIRETSHLNLQPTPILDHDTSSIRKIGETLFEAVAHTAVDFYGKSQQCGVVCSTTRFDLSRYVVGDEGLFDTRDELFAKFGSLQYSWRGRIFEVVCGGRKSA